MKRKDMDPKYQWDFTHIYPDKAAWENAMAEAEAAVAGLAALPGTLKKSKEGLKAGLDAAYAAMEKIELPFIYANLHKCADGSEPDHQTMDARAMTLMVKGMSMLAFLYRCIGVFIGIMGIIVSLFFPWWFSNLTTGLPLVYFAFYSFLATSMAGYIFNYKQLLVGANQKQYF